MSKEISLFSGYSQKENLVTNYTGLLFKMIYEENPELFEEFIQKIFPDITIGPIFSQQEKGKNSVFDLVINQNPFAVVVETKLSDWFYDDQLTRHLEGIKEKYKYNRVYLLLLSNFSYDEQLRYEQRFPKAQKIAKSNNIEIQQISFEKLGDLLMELDLTPMLGRFVKEYQDFLQQQNLISTWKKLMRAVPTGDTFEINKKYGIYYNPKYTCSPFKYLGLYKNKSIQGIGEVTKIIDRDLIDEKNRVYEYKCIYPRENIKLTSEEKERLEGIIKAAKELSHNIDTGYRFYFVNQFEHMDFNKISTGGLMGPKIFNLEDILNRKIENLSIQDLARSLEHKEWK